MEEPIHVPSLAYWFQPEVCQTCETPKHMDVCSACPRPGSVTLCLHCAELCVYNEDMTLRPITELEVNYIKENHIDRWRTLQARIRAVHNTDLAKYKVKQDARGKSWL